MFIAGIESMNSNAYVDYWAATWKRIASLVAENVVESMIPLVIHLETPAQQTRVKNSKIWPGASSGSKSITSQVHCRIWSVRFRSHLQGESGPFFSRFSSNLVSCSNPPWTQTTSSCIGVCKYEGVEDGSGFLMDSGVVFLILSTTWQFLLVQIHFWVSMTSQTIMSSKHKLCSTVT